MNYLKKMEAVIDSVGDHFDYEKIKQNTAEIQAISDYVKTTGCFQDNLGAYLSFCRVLDTILNREAKTKFAWEHFFKKIEEANDQLQFATAVILIVPAINYTLQP